MLLRVWPDARSNPPPSSHGPSGAAPIKPPHKRPTSSQKCNCSARACRQMSNPANSPLPMVIPAKAGIYWQSHDWPKCGSRPAPGRSGLTLTTGLRALLPFRSCCLPYYPALLCRDPIFIFIFGRGVFWNSGTDAVDGVRRHVRAHPGGRARLSPPRRALPPCRRSRIRSRRASSPRAARSAPGETVWVALHLEMRPGWHVYWRNPGDAGLPPEIAWTLPPGFTAGEIAWPTPERFVVDDIGNYGYAGAVDLLVPITAADPKTSIRAPVRTRAATAPIAAQATWLACADICIPGGAELALALPVAAAPSGPDPATGERCSPLRASGCRERPGWRGRRLPHPARS